jgi:adenylyltransferase/sulfurtransferase
VLGPAVLAVASFAAGLGLRILARPDSPPESALLELDVWNGSARRLSAPRDPACPVCVGRNFFHLHRAGAEAIALCGRNTVQIPARGAGRALALVARGLEGRASELQLSEQLLRFRFEDLRVSLFTDGRGLVEGTHDVARAEAVFTRALAGT